MGYTATTQYRFETPRLSYSEWDIPTGDCTLDGIDIGCGFVQRLRQSGSAVQAPVLTTVRLTYTSGRTETFTDYTNLPPGMNITFTGAAAQAASTGFNIGRALGDLSKETKREPDSGKMEFAKTTITPKEVLSWISYLCSVT